MNRFVPALVLLSGPGLPCCTPVPDSRNAAPPQAIRDDRVLPPSRQGLRVGPFSAETRRVFTAADGLPDDDALAVAVLPGGEVYAGTARGLARYREGAWSPVEGLAGKRVPLAAAHGADLIAAAEGTLYQVTRGRAVPMAGLPPGAAPRALAGGDAIRLGTDAGLFVLTEGAFAPDERLHALLEGAREVRHIAVGPGGRIAVAASGGLFAREADGTWERMHPRDGTRHWFLTDVRGAAYDASGRLWFASPQGVGRFDARWSLFTGHDGLPWDDFTCAAPGEGDVVWFGTTRGAVRFDGRSWHYRQGRRWLPDDAVRAVAVTAEGHAWFATARGVGVIERRPTTLAEKARFFEEAIDRHHRRTPYGYVDWVRLERPGDLSSWSQQPSDNDGLWTAMYGAGECFAYAATKSEAARRRAAAAFEALRFLSQVTQGGPHPAPPGFPARSILPVGGPDPNQTWDTPERDARKRAQQDSRWKVLSPRWPVSADGRWRWKCDTSSDELDGHFFFYARYHDLVAGTEAEKRRVRETVLAIVDHLIAHGFRLVDWDGRPTRWADFSPESLNLDPDWWEERGLNSLSLLSYLAVAEHVGGGSRYRRIARDLIERHGYAVNVRVPKIQQGPGTGNQSDDEMAFMSFFNLLTYERDPALRRVYADAFTAYWRLERLELNPFFNFAWAAACPAEAAGGDWLEEAVDTLKRHPLDRVRWALANSHRKDILPLPGEAERTGPPERGSLRNGRVLPIENRWVNHWNVDPWRLDDDGDGRELADGASFLLPYYMGWYHGFIQED